MAVGMGCIFLPLFYSPTTCVFISHTKNHGVVGHWVSFFYINKMFHCRLSLKLANYSVIKSNLVMVVLFVKQNSLLATVIASLSYLICLYKKCLPRPSWVRPRSTLLTHSTTFDRLVSLPHSGRRGKVGNKMAANIK
jgi:hypothetical protein